MDNQYTYMNICCMYLYICDMYVYIIICMYTWNIHFLRPNDYWGYLCTPSTMDIIVYPEYWMVNIFTVPWVFHFYYYCGTLW